MVYYSTTEGVYTNGQDPNEHSWMYSAIIAGQECILDCGRWLFGAWETVENDIYMGRPFPCGDASPAYIQDRDQECDSPLRYHETDRFCVLREPLLHDIPRHSLNDPTSEDTQAIALSWTRSQVAYAVNWRRNLQCLGSYTPNIVFNSAWRPSTITGSQRTPLYLGRTAKGEGFRRRRLAKNWRKKSG